MKTLLKLMLLCVFVSPVVLAQDTVEGPASVDEEVIVYEGDEILEIPLEEDSEKLEKKLIIPNIVYVKCTADLNQWGHASQCDCGKSSTYNQKLGKCIPKKLVDQKPRPNYSKPGMLRCTKDLNQWGHSGSCQCSSDNFDYDERLGKCVRGEQRVADEEPSMEDAPYPEDALEHCAGGSFSADFKHLTCPDGRVYEEQTNTLGEIGRDIHGNREHDFTEELGVDGESESGAAVITSR
ncbi:MAG: hypothetical protein NXH75_06260 [Halobacteriovoraceae bacterium]|nr:hypothetical protein [Halobacteriovoraceae bacterium]